MLNGANEAAVDAFLREKIPFSAITTLVETALDRLTGLPANTLEDIFEADRLARITVAEAMAQQ